MRKPRKNYTPVEKVAILRRHLIDHVPVSDLCDEHQLSPTLFYTWQKQFFESGPAAFQRKDSASDGHLQGTVAALRDKLQRKNEVVGELMEEHITLKKRSRETLTGAWVPRDTRDSIVDFVRRWAGRTEIPVRRFIGWLGIAASKFHDGTARYGSANEHDATVPRDWWLEPWEKARNSSWCYYLKPFFIGHYNPRWKHFFTCSIKGEVVECLDPKPITYRHADANSVDFRGLLAGSS